MRINALILILALFVCFIFRPVLVRGETTAYFDINRAVEKAKRSDLELGKLKVSLRELLRSKANLYRGMLPKLKTKISGSKSVLAGEADTSSYDFGLTLEQVLYDQFSGPIKIRGYYSSIDEAKIKVDQREKQIEAKVTDLYLAIIFGERAAINGEKKIELYEKLVDLMNVEYGIGTKTLIEVIESEKNLLEARLDNEDIAQSKEISYRDLTNLLDINSEKMAVVFDHNLEKIYYRVFRDRSITSVEKLIDNLESYFEAAENSGYGKNKNQKNFLYSKAYENDYTLKMLKIQLRNNALYKKLNGLLWLKNISVNCGVDFSGDRFFPVNRTYSLGVNILFDFGFFAPEVSVSKSVGSPGDSITESAESDMFSEASILNRNRALEIKAHNLKKQMDDRKRKIKRDIDVWLIKMNALFSRYKIYRKQKEAIAKNEDIVLLKKKIGELKDVEYLRFLVEKRDFKLKMDELSRDAIKLVWEFETILNMKMYEYWGLKNSTE